MSDLELQQSPNWPAFKDTTDFVEEGFPFNEDFPRSGPYSSAEFELIFRSGERLTAQVDYSTQYRAEGLTWQVTGPRGSSLLGRRLGSQVIVAWSELPAAE